MTAWILVFNITGYAPTYFSPPVADQKSCMALMEANQRLNVRPVRAECVEVKK